VSGDVAAGIDQDFSSIKSEKSTCIEGAVAG
jgi:hypothetical protein